MDRQWVINAPDGCIWEVYWFVEAAGFFTEAWDPDEWNDVPHDPEHSRRCTCPHVGGIYDTLETLELAMGGPIPADTREELLEYADYNPISEEDMADWGRSVAFEIHRTDAEGRIWGSFAPTWAPDPENPYWEHDNFPLVD